MKSLTTIFIAFAISVISTCQVNALVSWTEPTSLLGMRIDSDKFEVITKGYGTVIHRTFDNKKILHFESQGVSFVCIDKQIIEIGFQILPGKKIIDAPYSGTLPNNVIESSGSPEKAIRLLGNPIEDSEEGYRKLKYDISDKYMTLYYASQLEYVSITSKHIPHAAPAADTAKPRR